MSAAAATAGIADTEYARRVAAMILGVRLLGVVSGFTRGVFRLGIELGCVVIRVTNAGADPNSANSGFDLTGVIRLLRRALHMADALRARLRTPAVIAAMKRRRTPRNGEAKERPPEDPRSPLVQTLADISFMRRDATLCAKWREAITGMSDREVLGHIYGHLMQAAAMLGETEAAARIEKWACRAAALLEDAEAAEKAAAATPRTTRPVAPDTAEPEPEPHGMAASRPSHAAGCGPP